LTQTYQYLTRQKIGIEFREDLYLTYIKLVNRCYGINQEDINQDLLKIVSTQLSILLDRDYASPSSFIILNNYKHYELMQQIIEVFDAFSLQEYYNFANQEEFYSTLDIYRKRFSQVKINTSVIEKAVGKVSKKSMKRFNHRETI